MDKDTKMIIGLGAGIVGLVAFLGLANRAKADTTKTLLEEESVKAGSAEVGLVVGDDIIEMDATRYAEFVFNTLKRGLENGDILYNPAADAFKKTVDRNIAAAWVITQLPDVGMDIDALTPSERADVVRLTQEFSHTYFDLIDQETPFTLSDFAARVFDDARNLLDRFYDSVRGVFSWRPSADVIGA